MKNPRWTMALEYELDEPISDERAETLFGDMGFLFVYVPSTLVVIGQGNDKDDIVGRVQEAVRVASAAAEDRGDPLGVHFSRILTAEEASLELERLGIGWAE